MITRNSSYASNWFGTKSKAEKDEHQYQLSDVLLELEFVKHDLNLQIKSVKTQERETARYKRQFQELEEEIATTIASYQNIIAQVQNGDTQNLEKFKEEIDSMQK